MSSAPAAEVQVLAASRSLRRGWASLLGLALVHGDVRVSAREAPKLPDPSTGEIAGKAAISLSPATLRNGKLELLASWGFAAHLTRHEDPGLDLVFPCGAWFQPHPGWYRAWLEGEWQMSRYSLLLSYADLPFRGSGHSTVIPVVEAGRVALPPGAMVDQQVSLRVLHAGSYLEGALPRWELSRRKATSEVGAGLLMPVGPAIGALWDERRQRYTAISRPFEVKARQTVPVPLERPARAAHLVAQVQRPGVPRDAGESPLGLLLLRGGQVLRPDVEVVTAERVYAVWYGLAPGRCELRAESKQGFLAPRRLTLAAGEIARVVEALTPWISLDEPRARPAARRTGRG
jgi:hypothetical protein